MTEIFLVECTETDPHWPAIYIEADSAEEALQVVADTLAAKAGDIGDTMWSSKILPRESWTATPMARPFRFFLGPWCRD